MIIGNFSRGFQRHCKVIIDFSSSVNYPVNDAMLMENIEKAQTNCKIKKGSLFICIIMLQCLYFIHKRAPKASAAHIDLMI